jgi:hypothetical protein
MNNNNWENVNAPSIKKNYSTVKNVEIPIFSISVKYEEMPVEYFNNLLRQLVFLKRGMKPIAFNKIDLFGKATLISEDEFIKMAYVQYAYYKNLTKEMNDLFKKYNLKNTNLARNFSKKHRNLSTLVRNEAWHRRHTALTRRRHQNVKRKAKAGTKRRLSNITK